MSKVRVPFSGLVFVLAFSLAAYGVRWSPNEFDIAQEPGTEEVYRLVLHNDSDETVSFRIYVGDWLRDEKGTNDFGVPLNGARWTLDRSFSVGDVVSVRYTVQLPQEGEVGVQGTFRSWSPQVIDSIRGVQRIAIGEDVGRAPAIPGGLVSVARTVEAIDGEGLATVLLTIRGAIDFQGLTISEVYSRGVELAAIVTSEGDFDTINRSNADWINLSHDQVELAADERKEILMMVTTPTDYRGTYWSIIQAESRPVVIGEISGTQVAARPSVGLKVFVTAPGSENLSGEVIYVRERSTDPLTLEATFVNIGNVQLVVKSQVKIVDQSGRTVRDFSFAEYGRDYFRILPGSRRTITVVDPSQAPLPAGIYQAIVRFDFGGDNAVVGVRAFRVR